MTRFALSLAALFGLAACAATPVYGPASSSSDFGYTEQKIEDDRYRVTYRDNSQLAADDNALRRAAELTLQNGQDWFRIVSRDLTRERGRSGTSVGIGGATGGRNSSVGVGVQVPLGGGRDDVTVRLEFVMGSGQAPEDQSVYDAQAVLGNMVNANPV